jgi:hypothetical protein
MKDRAPLGRVFQAAIAQIFLEDILGGFDLSTIQ